jgi:hypothetical protein
MSVVFILEAFLTSPSAVNPTPTIIESSLQLQNSSNQHFTSTTARNSLNCHLLIPSDILKSLKIFFRIFRLPFPKQQFQLKPITQHFFLHQNISLTWFVAKVLFAGKSKGFSRCFFSKPFNSITNYRSLIQKGLEKKLAPST